MKMKNIFRNIFIGGAAAAMLCSCNLDIFPKGSIAYDESKPLFLNQNDVEAFQNGVLSSYRSLQYGVFTQTSEVMCDYFNASLDFGNNYGSEHRADDSFDASNYDTEAMWQSHYSAIKNYNIVIANAETVTDEALLPSVNVLKGIALFCRASSYLTLARHYGDAYDPATAETDLCVPLVLVYDQLEKPFRATVQEVYDQIYLDLEEAETLLSEAADEGIMVNNTNLAGAVRAEVPTVDAVHALMARYYLDTQDYQNAYDAALSVVESAAGYALANSGATMTEEYINDKGTEPIIQLYATITEGAVGNTLYAPVRKSDQVAGGKYFGSYFLPCNTLVNAYEANDLRFTTWFADDLYPVGAGASFLSDIYVFIKYYDNPDLRSGQDETGAKAAKPLMLSEMYLIAAEAAAMDGNEGLAKQVLNSLQAARGAAFTDGSMESVKMEWYKETVGEGLRFSCVKRWGDSLEARPYQPSAAKAVTTGDAYEKRTLSADSHVWNWPVPTYEMKLNKNLKQNPGYESVQ